MLLKQDAIKNEMVTQTLKAEMDIPFDDCVS